MNKILKYLTVLFIPFCITWTSCDDDFPQNIESDGSDKTVIQSIKIMNAGADGTLVLDGTVDEIKKEINFPRIDTLTNLSAIKLDAILSDGAKLEKDTYDFSIEQGVSKKAFLIRIYNEKRYRDYEVVLRLDIPVWGADFEKGIIYDFSNNPNNPNGVYPDFSGAATRGSGFDGKHVLVVSRGATGPHLLSVEDLKKGKLNPIKLNLENVTGGTFPYSSGSIINGRTYICTLAGGPTSPLRIYCWEDPSAAPQVLVNTTPGAIPGAKSRYGDAMSVTLDENGNGYIFMGDNSNPGNHMLRFTVTGYTQVTEPTILNIPFVGTAQYATCTRVGKTDDYLLTNFYDPIMVVSAAGSTSYTMKSASMTYRVLDPRIVTFNNKRYLIAIHARRADTDPSEFAIYDITKGATTTEALSIFEGLPESDRKPIYTYNLGAPNGGTPASQTEWLITKDEAGNDETLICYGAATDGGFIISEFPIAKQED